MFIWLWLSNSASRLSKVNSAFARWNSRLPTVSSQLFDVILNVAQVNDLNYGSLTKLELHCTVRLIRVSRESEERRKYIPAEKDTCESFCRKFLRAVDCRRTSKRIVNPNTPRTGEWLPQALLRLNWLPSIQANAPATNLVPRVLSRALRKQERESWERECSWADPPVHSPHASDKPPTRLLRLYSSPRFARAQCRYTR